MVKNFTIIIVTYNSQNQILHLLRDIKKCDQKALENTIIIDNDSRDTTVAAIQKNFPQVQCITNKENYGYAKALNQGISKAKHEALFVINPDMRIHNKKFFAQLLETQRKENQHSLSQPVAAVGPTQYMWVDGEKHLNFTWSYLSTTSFVWFLKKKWHFKNTRQPSKLPVRFLNCGCVLFSKKALQSVGKFNEKYFLYGEEADIFFKFMKMKYRVILDTSINALHFREKSLESLSRKKQISIKIQACRNIADASARGIWNLLQ